MSNGGKYMPWWIQILMLIAIGVMYAIHYWPITILITSIILALIILIALSP